MRMVVPAFSRRPARLILGSVRPLAIVAVAALAVLGSLGLWSTATNGRPGSAASALPPAAPPASASSPGSTSPSASTISATAFVSPSPSEGWTRLTGHGPAPGGRTGGSFAYDAAGGYSILFGGCGPKACPLGDTWKLQGGSWTNLSSSFASAPPPRTGAVLVDDAKDGYLLLFGGRGPSGALGDAWRFSGGLWSPLPTSGTSSPTPRYDAAATYDTGAGQVVLFGGVSGTGSSLGDTWTFSGGVWTPLGGTGYLSPSARYDAALAYDPSSSESVLFGGASASNLPLGDTWAFAQGEWTNLSAKVGTAPSPRYASAVATDPGRLGVVIYGGQNTTNLSDSWLFGPKAWVNLGINLSSSPLSRMAGSAAYDPTVGYVAMFGGVAGTTYRSGLWALLSPLSAQVLPTAASVAPGASDQFHGVPSGGLAPYNETWSFGDGSPPVTGPTASHTFQAAGTYGITLTVQDSLAATVATVLNLTVALPILSVHLAVGPTFPTVGETVTLTANASGGLPPYQFQWAGATTNCTSSTPSVLTCPALLPGTFGYTVAVTDSRGVVTSTLTNVTILGVAGTRSNGPGVPAAAGSTPAMTALSALAIALAITLACGIAVVTYRAGRRREAARLGERPLCYAVPVWSETPQEFKPTEPAAEPLAGPWDRPDEHPPAP